MPITETSKEDAKRRLARAMGHLDAVYRMVEEKRYCIDVLHQIKAVQSALDKVSESLLKQHLETCVVDAFAQGENNRAVEELMQVFRKTPNIALLSEQDMQLLQERISEKQNCCH